MYNAAKQKLTDAFPHTHALLSPYKTYVKYVIAGGTAAATYLGISFALIDVAGWHYLLGVDAAFIIALAVSFALQKFWTFRDARRNGMSTQAFVYAVVAVINLGITTAGVYVLVEFAQWWYTAAQIVMGAVVAIESFLVYRYVIFNRGGRAAARPDGGQMRIVIATGIYPPDIGGPATYAQILRRGLPTHGWEVKVVTYSDEAHNDGAYRIPRRQPRWKRYAQYAWQIWKLLEWADVVYVQGPVSEGVPVWLACTLRGRRYVLKVVGDYAWEQFSQLQIAPACPAYRTGRRHGRGFKLQNKKNEFVSLDNFQVQKFDFGTELKRNVQKMVARGANTVVVPSEYLKNIVRQWGVADERIEVVYNAVEMQEVAPKNKHKDEQWIVTVGRLVPWKGIDTLVRIMPEIVTHEPVAKLFVIGDGPQADALQGISGALHLKSTVSFLGKLPQSEVAAYLAAADVFVLNSAYEGLSHVLLEAIASGTPVVASDVGGNPEVVRLAGHGRLVPYNDAEQLQAAIMRALADGRHAPTEEFLQMFNQRTMIEHVNRILHECA